MLLILSDDSKDKVYKALGPILKTQTSPVEVCSSLEELGNYPAYTALLTMGSRSLEALQQIKVYPKNRKITGLRCTPHKMLDGRPVLCTYGPGIGQIDYGYYVDMLTDAQLAFRLAETGGIKPKYGDYQYVPDFQALRSEVAQLIAEGQQIELACDTETLGLDYLNPDGYIISIQLSIRPGMTRVVAFESQQQERDWLLDIRNQEDLAWLFSHPQIKTSGANFKYDLHWFWARAGIDCSNFVFDTTLVGGLLDENRSNGLDVHAKVYAPNLGGYSDEFDRRANKARMDLELQKDRQEFLKYAGGDTDAVLQVKAEQKRQLLEDSDLTRFYVKILHPAARAFEKIEQGGVLVDMDEYNLLKSDVQKQINECVALAKKIVGGRVVAKHSSEDAVGGLNLQKASFLKDFMFSPMGLNLKPKMVTEKTKEPSSAMEHMEMFSDVPEAKEFIALLKKYGEATKTLGTYIGEPGKSGFLKHLRSDGRFHPSYWLFPGNKDEGEGGTVTGRLSCKDPAFQTIPKHTYWGKRLRKVFKAPDGYLVMERDYSQGELKVMACIAGESTMIEAYKGGADLHVVTSSFVEGLTYAQMMELKSTNKAEYDRIRQLGKAGNFGLIYGMGVEGFMEYARVNYGVTLTYEQAESFRTGFFQRYPGLLVYHAEYKKFAKRYGYVRNPLGRVRHLPLINSPRSDIRSKAERQAINSPVQGCLSDMMMWTTALSYQMGWFDECPSFGNIHDASYDYIPEDNSEFYARRATELMSNLPFHEMDWAPQLQFTADAKIGRNMAELKELTFA